MLAWPRLAAAATKPAVTLVLKSLPPLLQREDDRCAQILLITPADSGAIIPALIKAVRSGLLVINLDNKLDNRALASHGVWHSLCRSQQFQQRARWETMCCGP
ncbi:hypothetical protein ACUXVY_09300 [Chromobacterium haemolyticum]|uniref:Uncharacterized protein n=1 Tax=Chromobacterium haemolyticum TaxID=394935 RepID=A0A1W0CBR3_9NEIS|nr:hypothetical protein [Chromobacterium haemolyticum]OQS32175.1 hypothetical protein B0T45_22110 [Chromobacterium haemolyticum]